MEPRGGGMGLASSSATKDAIRCSNTRTTAGVRLPSGATACSPVRNRLDRAFVCQGSNASPSIVEIEIAADRGARVRHAVAGAQVDLLVLHCALRGTLYEVRERESGDEFCLKLWRKTGTAADAKREL